MFSKLFSSNSVSEDHVQLIELFYNQYQSDIFPKGISVVCQWVSLQLSENHLTLTLKVPFACDSELGAFAALLLEQHDLSVLVIGEIIITQIKKHPIKGIKNIIAIASGKGGVGKSTTTVNLAYALQAEGAKVGILDADIYGPSIPKMLGLEGQKVTTVDRKLMNPLLSNGIYANSIGFLVDENDATIWRGPMASRAFGQLLNESAWPDIDYLLIDMPPGTGDIQLTLAQQVPVCGAIVVTTPQDVALSDAAKGITMFKKVNVPVLGVIENMSYHLCDNCGEKTHLFGLGGGDKLVEKFETELLGQLPLDISICQDADHGKSALIENSTSDISHNYRRIAGKVASKLFHEFDVRSPQTKDILFTQID